MDERFRILYSKEMKCNHNRSLDLDVSNTQIHFYDFVNKVNITSSINNAVELIRNANDKDFNRRLIVFVAGYKSNIKRHIEESIRQTFKDIPNVYLMMVDHSAYTYEDKDKIQSYLRSVKYSYYIGEAIGKLLSDLRDIGFRTDNMHCVGYSLGGHIVGYAAEVYKNVTKEKLWKVTGLDPAGPCFTESPIEEHIRSGIAMYVEVYHCNAGHFGTIRALADTDFYLNIEGKVQPNCDKVTEIEDSANCHHKACVRYWTKTVHHQELYIGTSCTSYEAFSRGLCRNNPTTMAGYFNPGIGRGIYYVSTEEVA